MGHNHLDVDVISSQTTQLNLSERPPKHVVEHHDGLGTTSNQERTDSANFTSQEDGELVILCDMGYGLPKEARSRKEKILAISRQLVNFLWWQQHHIQENEASNVNSNKNQCSERRYVMARLEILDCPDSAAEEALKSRMEQLWSQENTKAKNVIPFPFPSNISFSERTLSSFYADSNVQQKANDSVTMNPNRMKAVYLSPDASHSLDPSKPPPHTVVVGLLIDRRIQLNRSRQRAEKLCLPAFQLPLSKAHLVLVQQDQREDQAIGLQTENSDCKTTDNRPSKQTEDATCRFESSEPLNVDCVLEMVQQWHWNSNGTASKASIDRKRWTPAEACFSAIHQALEHHAQRHPSRIQHKTTTTAT